LDANGRDATICGQRAGHVMRRSDEAAPASGVDEPGGADRAHMQAALGLARRGLGTTWPNPSVGCVIVKASRVVGRGVTAAGGRPHAEPTALAMAGDAAKGATAYVTLEPCCHWGRSPPCTDTLIQAGLARVVIATGDPDPRVNGAGVAQLKSAGIRTEVGLCGEEAREILAGFACRIARGRPLVTLKLATTLDGRIATRSGESQWITAAPARRLAHALRGRHDAVLVGVGTVLADDPALTCRIDGFRNSQPVRVIADSHLRTPLTSRLMVSAAAVPTWFLIREGTDPARRAAFKDLGATLIEVPGAPAGVDLAAGLQALGTAGLTRVLAEGGGKVAAALLRAGVVDRLAWFHAPVVMGGDGWPAVQAFGVEALDHMPRFRRHCETVVGDDILTEYARLA
jgi:diaminohydroxyphosphoribosylaminopyrimidine deaminase/5-amino-6-(5-phosphoribosylamino)uracil reductase